MIRYLCLCILLATPIMAQPSGGSMASSLPNPVVMVIVLGALSLAPFVVIMLTSFVKISVVLSILRNALGTQQVPPNQVITGLAFILSIFVMTPVAKHMYEAAGSLPDSRDIFSEASIKGVMEGVERGREPLRHFLERHAHEKDRILFMQLAATLEERDAKRAQDPNAGHTAPASPVTVPSVAAPQPGAPASTGTPSSSSPQSSPPANVQTAGLSVATAQSTSPQPEQNQPPAVTPKGPGKSDFQVLIPAFVTSQLQEAFQIGFLVFLPFIVIDMVIANVLLAMGMSMLSPSVISLPFKLLLFVLVDGWFLIARGLVLSYA